ncbi:MAG: FecR family protein [Spirochaetia bacterium]|nr:FecR domain-containing protein [Spirochaetota bacterium]MDW8112296.1 FecR family protein [Spirochaetia bacterium]
MIKSSGVSEEGVGFFLQRRIIILGVITILVIGLIVIVPILIQSVFKEDTSLTTTIGDPSKIQVMVSVSVGDVKALRGSDIFGVEVGDVLRGGDTIITGPNSECVIQVGNGVALKILENTSLSIAGVIQNQDKQENIFSLVKGSIVSLVKKLNNENIRIRTSTGLALVRGTKFMVSSDNDKTTLIVSDGKVASSIRSKAVGDIFTGLSPEQREKLVLLEGISEVDVESGKQIDVSKADQNKVDEKVKSSLSSQDLSNIDNLVSELSKTVSEVSKGVKLTTKDADKSKLELINKSVSEDMIVDLANSVEVSFILDPTAEDLAVFVNDVALSKGDSKRFLEKNKTYTITIKSRDTILYREEIRFNKKTKIIIKRKGINKIE